MNSPTSASLPKADMGADIVFCAAKCHLQTNFSLQSAVERLVDFDVRVLHDSCPFLCLRSNEGRELLW